MTRDNIINRRLIGLFLMGYLLFNYPFLSLFNLPAFVLGFPLLYAYLFAAWAAYIVLIVLITHSRPRGVS
ncbi:MAG TPA: hypothetical protein VK852_11925 [Desulfobacterales bacterium]|jgi:hypothetical protein|nr:hypothetical protein [Desulfobacterales bacterium]